MAVRTKLLKSDIVSILSNYALGEHRQAAPCTAGNVQTTMLLTTTEGKFVLRYYDIRSHAEVLFEANILTYLHKRGYPAPAPMRNSRGRLVGRHRGRPYMILEFLQGRHIAKPSRAQLNEIVRAAATLHNVSRGYRPSHQRTRKGRDRIYCWNAALERARRFTPQAKAKARLRWLRGELAALKFPGSLPKGICHSDYHYSNFLFIGGRLSGVVDFDDACRTYPIYDIANLLDYWAQPYAGKRDLARARDLLKEYQRHRPLSAVEKRHLYDALKLQILIDSVWCFGRGGDDSFIEKDKIDLLNRLGREGFCKLLFS